MRKQYLIFKSVIVLVLILALSSSVYARSGIKFIGTEQEATKMSAIESVSPESARKLKLEALISDPSPNIRWNVAKMLAEIGDSQSLKLLQAQIPRETDRLARDKQIQAVYAIKFRQAILSGQNPESELLGFFYSGYYPLLRSGTPSGEPYDSTVYVINQLVLIGSSGVRSYINQILDLSKNQDLGLLPETCTKAIYILDNYRVPQKYVVALRTGDLGLKYWAVKELAEKAKTETLSADNKTVIDLLKAQLFFAKNNGYDNYYNYVNDILKNNFGETIAYIEPSDVYENKPPIIRPIENKTIYEEQILTINVTADDPDGGLPKVMPYIMLKPLPKGATFKGNVFSWTPAISQEGSYKITVSAQDEYGSVSSVTFTINVLGLPPKSIIKNTGTTALTGYLLMKIQKLEGQTWQDFQTIVKDTSARTIQPGEELNLRDIWNSKNYIANEAGKFRISAEFLNEKGEVLLSDTSEFEVLQVEKAIAPLMPIEKEASIETLKQKIAEIQQKIIQLLALLIELLKQKL